ncbi:hypothetical protein EWM64_g4700 [Hericium alpestre]|uniref:RNA methyltransferase n=1 Tax=Hericium alpestre TaxID=135208 RepID=A0A4Y9ZYN7_9AGAM|nr:hypothetical protein EWM64_g4700 [Hericium alpestre]
MGARRVVGVDIDDALVRMAWKRRRALWSFQEPSDHTEDIPRGQDKKRRRDERDDKKILKTDYFPASCQYMFGPLPILPVEATASGAEEFPHNVSFRRADWVNEVIPEDADMYDVIVGFSVAKWIHLNGGDEGLKKFFRRVYDALAPGGTFVFEPQQWESYTKARKLDATLQENAKKLELRPDDFGHLLEEISFTSCERLGEVGEGPVNVLLIFFNMAWPDEIAESFKSHNRYTEYSAPYFGPYNRLLNHYFPSSEKFEVVPRPPMNMKWNDGIVFVVTVDKHPVFYLLVRPPNHLDSRMTRIIAENEMMHYYERLDRYQPEPAVIPTIHGVIAMGTRLAFYKYSAFSSEFTPPRASIGTMDRTPKERWDMEILDEDTEIKMCTIMDEVKAMSSQIQPN